MLHMANQIRQSQSFYGLSSRGGGFFPPATNTVKFTTAAAHEPHNDKLHCCAELSSQAIVFFDPRDRWGTHVFFCTRSHRWLLLDGPAPGGDLFVHHGVTSSEDRRELELFPHSFFLLFPFSFPNLIVPLQALHCRHRDEGASANGWNGDLSSDVWVLMISF